MQCHKSDCYCRRVVRFSLFHRQPNAIELLKIAHIFEECVIFTLFRMETVPLAMPSAKYWPSFVQAQQFIRDVTLNFCTAFCSVDQNAKSDCVHDTS